MDGGGRGRREVNERRVTAGEGRRLTRGAEMGERVEELAEGEPIFPAYSVSCVGGADGDLQRVGLL